MKAYFYDNDMRYIGCRELADGEPMPKNATTEPVTLIDGQQAHFIDGEWVISDVQVIPESLPDPPSLDEQFKELDAAFLDFLITLPMLLG